MAHVSDGARLAATDASVEHSSRISDVYHRWRRGDVIVSGLCRRASDRATLGGL